MKSIQYDIENCQKWKKSIKLLEINRNQFVSPWFYKLIQTEYHVISIESSDFRCQNLWNKGQKGIKPCLDHSIFKNFSGGQCFFLDAFIPFCSAFQGLLNSIETSMVGY
jgi:hypothetical protein